MEQNHIESFRTIQSLHPLTQGLKDQILNQGFTTEQVQNFLDTIDLDMAMLCYLLNISGIDLKEIFKQDRFNKEMSGKILAIAEIYARGYHVFQSRRLFNNWMKRESFAFHFVSPLSLLNSPEGIKKLPRRIRRVGYTSC